MTTLKVGVLLLALGHPLVTLGQKIQAFESTNLRHQFVQSFCMDCHGAEKQKGDFRIDLLSSDMSDERFHDQWEPVLDYVEFEDMPPDDAKQYPSDSERKVFVNLLASEMKAAYESATIGRTPLRRLNRNEYLNTINDLIGVRGFKLPNSVPPDSTEMPFDTMPEGLYLSPALLDAYLETAGLVADILVPQTVRPRLHRSEAAFIGVDLARKWTKEGDPAVYLTGANTSPWSGGIWVPNSAASVPGMYRVRLLASAEAAAGADGKPLRFSFHLSNPTDYPIARRALNVNHPRVASVDVPHNETAWVECIIPVEQGEVIYAFCENRFSEPPLPYATKQQINQMMNTAKASDAPTLRVEAMEVEGPIAPLPRQLEFLNHETPRAKDDYVRKILVPFAQRAYRRPLTTDEADALVSLSLAHVSGKEGEPLPPAYAIHYGVRRILTSPEFLYLETESSRQDDYILASRLSYFLWSSPPDETLLNLASKSQLSDPAQLELQVVRMIADPRSEQFIKHFAGQWLENRKAERLMVCDVRYQWSEMIRHGFIRSSELFLEEILRENLPIMTFIDSDFIYANEPMLESWGLPVETSILRHEANFRHYMSYPELKRYQLDEFASDGASRLGERGGILGLPSVLSATGDGVESSAILRGVWVLDNLFGTPVPPPPANVPAIDVDTSQANGIREIIDAHKTNESCNKCHRSIDPIGLALENYDALGGWRDRYQEIYQIADDEMESKVEGDVPSETFALETFIDASGMLPDGTALSGPKEIKEYLFANRELFTRCLTTKLFEYGTGREPSLGDRRVIDQIVSREPESGYGMIDLIKALIQSESFFVQ
jgi:hypothetical protein